MTEQHRHHLRPTAKTPCMMLRFMIANRLLKFSLRKNTAYSIHGGKLLLFEIGFLENPNLNLAGFPPPLKTLIWTGLKFRPPLTGLDNSSSHAASLTGHLSRILTHSLILPPKTRFQNHFHSQN